MRRFALHPVIVLVLALAGGACSALTEKSSDDRSADEADDDENDRADEPVMVAGAFLMGCGAYAEAADAANDGFGCGLYDANSKKKFLGSLANLKVELARKTGGTETPPLSPAPPLSPWHVAFRLPKGKIDEYGGAKLSARGALPNVKGEIPFDKTTADFVFVPAPLVAGEASGTVALAPDVPLDVTPILTATATSTATSTATGTATATATATATGTGTGTATGTTVVVSGSQTIFLTSRNLHPGVPFNGALGDGSTPVSFGSVADADLICQQLAGMAGLTGTFKALLSDAGTSAASHVPVTNDVYDPAGDLFLPAAGFYTQAPAHPMLLNELGVATVGRTSSAVWTGASSGGGSAATTCVNWSSGSAAASGITGNLNVSGDWLAYGPINCGSSAPVYCVSSP